MRILVINMYYLRPGDAGIRRFTEFGRIWSEQHNAHVTVVAGQLHYNTGEVYPDLAGKAVEKEKDGPVEVVRVASADTYNNGFAGRAWCQYSWARNVSSLLREFKAPDVVIASSPHLWVANVMVAAKRLWKCPAVFEVRDVWPEAIVRMGIAGPRHPGVIYLGGIERRAYRHADHIVTTAESQRQNIIRRGFAKENGITTVTNGVVLSNYDSLPDGTREKVREELGIVGDQTLAMYVGSHGPLYDLINLVELAEALKERLDIRIVSIGEGKQRQMLAGEVERCGLSNITFYGPVPTDAVPKYLSAADIGLSLVKEGGTPGWDKQTLGVFRNSLFDIAGARLPVVFNDPGLVVGEIQDKAKAGFHVSLADGPGEMASRVIQLADDQSLARRMGQNNYEYIARPYNREDMAARYMEILSGLAGNG